MNARLEFERAGVGRPLPGFPWPVSRSSWRPGMDPLPLNRPLMVGDRNYLRALRAAEMKAWQASGGDALNLTP